MCPLKKISLQIQTYLPTYESLSPMFNGYAKIFQFLFKRYKILLPIAKLELICEENRHSLTGNSIHKLKIYPHGAISTQRARLLACSRIHETFYSQKDPIIIPLVDEIWKEFCFGISFYIFRSIAFNVGHRRSM